MITLDRVTKVYPGEPEVVALDDISLEIDAGEIHGIVGESGAGKSTLIRCLTALERPTSGKVWVAGEDLASMRASQLRKARRKIGMVFQGGHLFDSRTILENVAYPMRIAGVDRANRTERARELLGLVGLPDRERAYPAQLSGGQRQRVAIARALAGDPDVLLCDEPTSALDTQTTHQILELISQINERTGVTVVIITHEMEVVRQVCTNVTLLASGKIVQTGSVEGVVRQPHSPLGLALVPPPDVDGAKIPAGQVLLDVTFNAEPNQPVATTIIELAAKLGADITTGRFETFGNAQVARLVLSISTGNAEAAIARIKAAGARVERRAA